jgi:hypothetical protein
LDRRRFALQLRAILVTYRTERRRRDSMIMGQFRQRARELLDELEEGVAVHPDLRRQVDAARAEIDADEG